ncbi:hypothetical protein ACFCYC_14000 [Streptomyces sp. NPDC056402]|uniref:hypothetical protein n=1 Tax=Streptomyces sp. NPDC056402 TaxID=3345810 RepID=UPI0035D8B516
MASDRIPARLRARFAPVRVHGRALLALYAVAPLNAIPRLADAAPELSPALTATAGIVAVAGYLTLGQPRHRPVDVNAEHPGHPSFEGAPDVLVQPVETRVRAVGRDTGAHLPIVITPTDTPLRCRRLPSSAGRRPVRRRPVCGHVTQDPDIMRGPRSRS